MGKKSRAPSAEARVVKNGFFSTRLTFPLLGFYFSSLFLLFLLVLLFF